MTWSYPRLRCVRFSCSALVLVAASGGTQTATAQGSGAAPADQRARAPRQAAAANAGSAQGRLAQVIRGRKLVIDHGCADCHGGGPNPAAQGFLAGYRQEVIPPMEFLIGPCAQQTGATPCFRTKPRNLTPDNSTGLGRFSERQIFNSMRYGLRPGETPDVEISGNTPGKGNFPMHPKYLAPPMPWPAFRHMSDQELRDIVAYLKHGLKPVSNRVPDSEGPPDFWAGEYTVEKIGPYPAAPFPTDRERKPQ